MSRDEELAAVRDVLAGEPFAVFAFAGDPGESPYSSVMFFASTEEIRLIFATTPGSMKGRYLRDGNGACAQVDNRGVGLEKMSEFARVTIQGFLQRIDDPEEREELHVDYLSKLPQAKVFMQRPSVETWVLEPTLLVFSRGLGERFELDFPETAA